MFRCPIKMDQMSVEKTKKNIGTLPKKARFIFGRI
jgi:hypothetical protein